MMILSRILCNLPPLFVMMCHCRSQHELKASGAPALVSAMQSPFPLPPFPHFHLPPIFELTSGQHYGQARYFPLLSHPFPLPNPILYLGIPCALVKLME
jgi:hypothetical protein